MFDDVSTNENVVKNGFRAGDMVWGKVKSHLWWPGHIFSEEFVIPSVRRRKRDGLLLVAFFGDSSYKWFDQSELILFDVQFAEKHKQTNPRQTSHKAFVNAVEDALNEVSRRSALAGRVLSLAFGEKYAQAFGHDPVLPSHASSQQPASRKTQNKGDGKIDGSVGWIMGQSELTLSSSFPILLLYHEFDDLAQLSQIKVIAGEKQAYSEVANRKARSSAAKPRLTAACEQTLYAQEEAGEWKRKYDVAVKEAKSALEKAAAVQDLASKQTQIEAEIKDKARKIEQAEQRVIILNMELKGLSNLYFMRGFLWSHGALKQVQAKVGWSDVCLPKILWFGDGSTVSIWFDNWLFLRPLSQYIHKRDILKLVSR
ncbi:tudor/PWWP/MBT superfamily protein [Tanacetum coccineum]